MGTHRLILIRADGNHEIASGHLMRCLSIALACQSFGMKVCFLVSQGESLSLLGGLLEAHGCAYQVEEPEITPLTQNAEFDFSPKEAASPEDPTDFPADSLLFTVLPLKTAVYDQPEQELLEVPALLRNIGNHQKPVFLLDSYYVTEAYLSALRTCAKLAYIDDLQLFDYPVDLLINYDVIPEEELSSYQNAYRNSGQLLLGASYAPLRSQFHNRECTLRDQVQNILITTGGSDPCHLCLHLVRRFAGAVEGKQQILSAGGSPVTVHMVLGKLNTDREALYRLAGNLPFLRLHENVADMASLMESCDLAISAAGTTLYELCALGVPTISFSMADNQLPSARAFDAVGAIPWAGDIRKDLPGVMDLLFQFMRDMCQKDSLPKRKSAHETMRRLTDGNGAFRIAEALHKL